MGATVAAAEHQVPVKVKFIRAIRIIRVIRISRVLRVS